MKAPNWPVALMLAMAIAAPALAQPKPRSMATTQAEFTGDSAEVTAIRGLPHPGDTWTYRLTEHPPGGKPPVESSYVVKVRATPGASVLDEVSRNGGASVGSTHSPGRHMIDQVVSVFSPYLVVFEDLKPGDRFSRVTEHDDDCFAWTHCWTAGRVEGRETIQIAAGSFDTIKVTLDQNILKRVNGARISTRKLTIWYSPQAKRAVKVTSRVSRKLRTTFHTNFDLELLSYQLDRAQVVAPKEAVGSEPRQALVVGKSADVKGQAAPTRGFPRIGDTWTYRLAERRGGNPLVHSSYVVKVKASSATTVIDEVSRDGAAPVEWTHSPGKHMVEQVVSVFSPYLVVFEDLKPGDPISHVTEHDGCSLHCSTVGRVDGRETLRVAAGKFDTIKVTLEQMASGMRLVDGGAIRTLTIWYSPQVNRAIKVRSRSFASDSKLFHASFDLELVSYQLQ